MRQEHSADNSHARTSTNGSSSQNGASSPHAAAATNGAAAANGQHTNGHTEGAVAAPRPTGPFFGHDREEVTRLILQGLSDLGYDQAARQLSSESGYELEIPSVAAFRNAVQHGEWEDAEALLFGTGSSGIESEGASLHSGSGPPSSSSWRNNGHHESNGTGRPGLPLAEGADTTMLKFLLRQQKYLELLETRDTSAALIVLRSELTPLKRDISRLHALSSLIMCQSAEDLRSQAGWDGAAGESRVQLLSELSQHISPSVMIPEHRLATLLTSLQDQRILECQYHNNTVQPSLYTDHECSGDEFPLHTLIELKNHADEVWYLEFSRDGTMLATAGKDGLVCVYNTSSWRIIHEFREHERTQQSTDHSKGICFVAFSPDSQHLISCSQNNELVVVNVRDGRRVAVIDHFDYPVTTAAWLPDSTRFVVGAQGSRRPLGLYTLAPNLSAAPTATAPVVSRNHEIHSWRDPAWQPSAKDNPIAFRVTGCTVSRDGALMAATTVDCRILMYDLHTREKTCEWTMDGRLTSINFSNDGSELLINMNEGRVLTLDAATGDVIMRYDGAAQVEFVLRSCFGGAGDNFVVSGSEDSRICVWRRQSGALIASLEAHAPGTVNAVAWHPTRNDVFASCGDDRCVRIWSGSTAVARTSPRSLAEAGGLSGLAAGSY